MEEKILKEKTTLPPLKTYILPTNTADSYCIGENLRALLKLIEKNAANYDALEIIATKTWVDKHRKIIDGTLKHVPYEIFMP